ncbi:MAG: hypothetical protein RIR01_2295 [Bacteroidota bacterium]|jgi:hypothetical protein
MANWCYNSVLFEGDEKNISALTKIVEDMVERANKGNCGVIPLVQEKELDNYYFEIHINEKSETHLEITYSTKHNQNPLNLNFLCVKFGVDSMYGSFSEESYKVYGEYKFEDNTFYTKELTDAEFDSCEVLLDENTDEVLKRRADYLDNEEEWDELTEQEDTYTTHQYELLDDILDKKDWIKLKT